MFGEVGVGDGLSERAVVGIGHVGLHRFAQIVRFLGDVVVVTRRFEGTLERHAAGGGTPPGSFYSLPVHRILEGEGEVEGEVEEVKGEVGGGVGGEGGGGG